MSGALREIDAGSYCEVYTPGNGTVTKLTLHTFDSLGAAEEVCSDLMTYAAALAESSIATARVLEATPLEVEAGYKVSHRMEYIDGPGLYDVSRPERDKAVKAIIGGLATAAEGPHPHSLATPVDAHLHNYHLGGDGPVLVDVCPPYRWNDQDLVVVSAPLTYLPPAGKEIKELYHQRMQDKGLKSGSIARLLAHYVVKPSGSKGRSNAWKIAYQPFLPSDINPSLGAAVYHRLAPLVGYASR
jgi:hypothetical protein